MEKITEEQYKSLTDKIFNSIMAQEDMGFGEMGEARDEAEHIVDEWLDENNITRDEE